MRPEKDQLGTLKFIAIGVMLMLLMDKFVFDGKRSYIEELRTKPVAEATKPPPVRVVPPDGKEYFEAPPVEEPVSAPVVEKEKVPDATPIPQEEEKKTPPKAFVPHGAPKIAIVIDDIGMDVKRSREALNLPAPVTMAMLPYAPKVREIAAEAKAKGHPLIIHTPMEAEDGSANIGPGGLKEGMSSEALQAAFGKMLTSFEGYEGINNHMGSRLTQDDAAMAQLMAMLKEKGLFFLDSKTSAKSIAVEEAQQAGVAFASRDVFLDHVDSATGVENALKNVENIALRRGYAIAIGHPNDHTLAGLRAWIPTLKEKGIELVPVKLLLVKPSQNVISREGEKSKMDPPNKSRDDSVVSEDDNKGAGHDNADFDMFPAQSPTGVTVVTEP